MNLDGNLCRLSCPLQTPCEGQISRLGLIIITGWRVNDKLLGIVRAALFNYRLFDSCLGQESNYISIEQSR